MRLFNLLLCFFLSTALQAQVVRGTVKAVDGSTLPSASIYLDQSTYGVSSNLNGSYFIELSPGEHTIAYSYVGYETQLIKVQLVSGQVLSQNVVLKPTSAAIFEVEIVADKRDRGTEIMRAAIDNRKDHRKKIERYACQTYCKTSLEKSTIDNAQRDSVLEEIGQETIDAANLGEHFDKQNLNLIETISTTYFKAPGRYKEIVQAYHDYARKPLGMETTRSMSATWSADIGPRAGDIAPEVQKNDNVYLFYEDATSSDLDFYRNTIDFPALSQKPLLSPIASTALLSYKFYFEGSFKDGDKTIYHIRVEPRNKTEALFEGMVFIEDGSFALVGVDLRINEAALLFCRDFRLIQNYEDKNGGRYVPVRRELVYTIKEGRNYIMGNTRVDHDDYNFDREFDTGFFGAEMKRYEVDAFEKDSTFWADQRPLILTENELAYIHKTDSIEDYFESDEYFRKLDSTFNRVDWLTPLAGYGRRNRIKGNELYIEGIMGQINPFGIGGYRHRLPVWYTKTLKDGRQIKTESFLDYGFKNKDVKGRVELGFVYVPEKFIETSVKVGDFYELINDYASVEQIFSRSNYSRVRMAGIGQKMEVVNGLYAEVGFEYADQKGIQNLDLSRWSEQLFGDLNNPTDFKRYTRSIFQVKLKYRFHQKYVMRGKQKIVVGTNYPELDILYKKGIPGMFNSEVNYDYVQIDVFDDIQMARFGYSQWSATAGTYLNKNNLRELEYKFFRGSDRYFFSNPVYSLQLLGPTLSSPNEFLQANFIHHFEGTILNKVPLLNRLKLQIAGGGGLLTIPDSDFLHAEVFAGLERVFRIKEELFRLSVFAVTADSSVDTPDFSIKFGISFYNTFTQRWEN